MVAAPAALQHSGPDETNGTLAPLVRLPGMRTRTADEVADLLEEIGRRATFEGGNPYKAKAYVRAAASLRRLAQPLADVVKARSLRDIPGVGEAIARRIEALHRGETDVALEKMRRKLLL